MVTSTLMNCATNLRISPSPKERADAPHAGTHRRRLRKFSVSPISTAAPQHGEERDIFERLYATRLDRLRALDECRSLLAPLDHQGLLTGMENAVAAPAEEMDDDELLAELEGAAGATDITDLRHVRTTAEKRAAEEIANREPCEDFDRFKPLFTAVDLHSGVRIDPQRRRLPGRYQGRGHPWRPGRLRRRSWRALQSTQWSKRRPPSASSIPTAPRATCCSALCNAPSIRTR